MDGFLKQSTATTVKLGPFVDDTDGKSAETGLTISQADVRLSKNGGNMAQKADATACTHDEIGYYDCPLNTTDTGTLGRLKLMVHESGALPVWHEFMIVPANVWDSFFGADKLQVHVDEMTAGIITASVIANDAIDAAALASDVATEIAAGISVPSAATIADAVWDKALSGHTAAGSAGKALSDAADGEYIAGSSAAALSARHGYEGILYGQFATGTLSATQGTTNLTGYANDALIGRVLTITSGLRIGQQTTITDYASSGGVLTFSALTGAPANGDEFFIA